MEEDTVPPVAMTASTVPTAATDDVTRPAVLALPARPQLRLVSSPEADAPEAEAHGWGGPASCTCRACTMARHPAATPRLTVVR
jgi:hypothetical protein